jgi:hypothetical protein
MASEMLNKKKFAWRTLAVAAGLGLMASLLSPMQRDVAALAADLTQFNAGNIISDNEFFDGASMGPAEIQSFLNERVPTCTINNGQPSRVAGAPFYNTSGALYSTVADTCLKDYSQATPDVAAQPGACSPYSGRSSESAAQIIARIGQACNISPKVLIVLLQKEQVLVTDTWPLVKQYNEATGFECYDNGQPCVGGYAGFFFQVWAAARQFQRYGTGSFTWYPVGQVSSILYQANRPECGTKEVRIENRATAALYYYTPYTPNSAALAAGYGLGDACSAYGNRNFYQMYVDWFGSTHGIDVPGNIGVFYTSLGSAGSTLGAPTSAQVCALSYGGCRQEFRNGAIYDYPPTGTFSMTTPIRSLWLTQGAASSALGLPTESAFCGISFGGCRQTFQNGAIYDYPPTGTFSMTTPIRNLWIAEGGVGSTLGLPTGSPIIEGSGATTQNFQHGLIVQSPSGLAMSVVS